jgi:hypothetical protein
MSDTLREQLAASAPAVADWFKPSMASPYPTLPEFPTGLNDSTVAVLQNWLSDPCWDLDPYDGSDNIVPADRDHVAEFVHTAERIWKEQVYWRRKQVIQRVAQWPWYYADLVIGARDQKVGR